MAPTAKKRQVKKKKDAEESEEWSDADQNGDLSDAGEATSNSYRSSMSARENDQKKRAIGDVVNFFLSSQASKGVIRLSDMKSLKVLEDVPLREQGTVIRTACDQLGELLGVEILEKTSDDGKRTGTFYFRNLHAEEIGENTESYLSYDKEELAKKGLLLTVLMFLFMSDPENCVAPEKHLFTFLSRLGIEEKMEYKAFGKIYRNGKGVQGFFQDLIRQGWLETSKIAMTDPVEYEYRWGYRTKMCLDKLSLLQFICKVYGKDCKPEEWTQYYDVARKESGNFEENMDADMDDSENDGNITSS